MNDYKQYLDYLVSWLQLQAQDAKMQGVIIGISGGIDSAVVALIGQKAFPKNHLTVTMPCYSPQIDKQYAELLVKTHNLQNQVVDLSTTYDFLVQNLKITNNKNHLVLANIKPRLRMTTLYSLAQAHNYLVLGTDNADEWHTGYFTKYGDGAADLVPIIHLLKNEVYQLAKLLNVPSEIVSRPPSASLWENQTDEMEMGITYQQLDDYLNGKAVDKNVSEKITRLHQMSEHKRNLPVKPKKMADI